MRCEQSQGSTRGPAEATWSCSLCSFGVLEDSQRFWTFFLVQFKYPAVSVLKQCEYLSPDSNFAKTKKSMANTLLRIPF